MTLKIGRNDPCPCGSGKKYKQCCANSEVMPTISKRKGHDGAVERAVQWLMTKHGEAASRAIDDMLFDGLSPNEQEALQLLDTQTWEGIQLNATEWLLAEGQIQIKGKYKLVSECLLGQGGPLFTVEQRQWIKQLSECPLRLYDITHVVPGQQMTLCDALATDDTPIIVFEKAGSQASLIGTQVGCRLMETEGHYELSGGVYPFSRMTGPALLDYLHSEIDQLDDPAEFNADYFSFIIRRKWIEQYIAPRSIPTMMDAYSGEPMLLITDHYRVKSWKALEQALAGQSNIHGNRESGWSRFFECKDGQTRSDLTINLGHSANKITVFYKTQRDADNGRPWFEVLATNAVQFVIREISDIKGMIANMPPTNTNTKSKPQASTLDIPPEMLADLVEKAIHRMYANWVNEKIPLLDGKTPKQAMKTAAGLERVKGLIRSYESLEKAQALDDGRREISYAFLWDALGIKNS